MSFILLGILNSQAAGQAAATFWLATLGGANQEISYGVATDSQNNSYAIGESSTAGAGSTDVLLAKHDADGAIQWQRVLGGTGADEGNAVAVDSSDNVYIVGSASPPSLGFRFLVAKYNSSGTLQWQKTFAADQGWGITIDSSGNIYVTGYTTQEGLGSRELIIAKYDSTGAIQWQKLLGDVSSNRAYDIAIDSSNNLYVCGQHDSAANGDDFLIAKYNSSGVIQWQRLLAGASADTARGIAVDSSSNLYIIGETYSEGAGSSDFLLTKYNSSGTIQWQVLLGGASGEIGYSVAIDSADDIYVTGRTDSAGAGSRDFLIAKYNSSGTIQWQRTLGANLVEDSRAIAIDSQDSLHVYGYTTSAGEGSEDFLLAKLPNDGSLTGTYSLDGVNFSYSASALTAATATLTDSTPSLTAATSTASSTTSSFTAATSTLVSHFVQI